MKEIKLIIYDFDGVMTNNRVLVDQNGMELVQVNRADGLAVSEIKKLNIKQMIVSTEKNSVVSIRAKKLGIDCLQGVNNKKSVLLSYIDNKNLHLKNIIYIGNDINDLEVMKIVGYKFCPSDAHESIKKIADKVLTVKGGDGVIRELLDLILEKRG